MFALLLSVKLIDELIDTISNNQQTQPNIISNSKRPGVGLRCLIFHRNKNDGLLKFLVGIRKLNCNLGMYQLPGGYLEHGESWNECASRKTLEETNLNIKQFKWNFCFVSNSKLQSNNNTNNNTNNDKHCVDIIMSTMYNGDINKVQKINGWKWINFYNHNINQNQMFCALKSVLSSKYFNPTQHNKYSKYVSCDFWNDNKCINNNNNNNKNDDKKSKQKELKDDCPFVMIDDEVYQIAENDINASMNVTSYNGELLPPFLSSKGIKWLNNNYKTNELDIFVDTYAKSGTTLTIKLIYQILIANKTRIAKADATKMSDPWNAVPWIEAEVSQQLFKNKLNQNPEDFLKLINNSNNDKSYRIWKSHMSYSNLLKNIGGNNEKIIHTIRNPKSVFASYASFFPKEPLVQYKGDVNTLFEWFCDGTVVHSNYWDHEIEWLNAIKVNKNILLIHFEDIVKFPVKSIKAVAKFLNVTLNDDQITYIAKKISLDDMKKDATTTMAKKLINKGSIARWKQVLSPQQSAKIDRISNTKFHDYDIKLIYQ